MTDVRRSHEAFYAKSSKKHQNNFILKHCSTMKVKRRRPRNGKNKSKEFTIKYKIYSIAQKKNIPVCQSAFLKVYNIKRYRIEGILKKFHATGAMPQEGRGGDRVSHKFSDKRKAIKDFIKSLHCHESHYCRSKSQRFYLPPELNINKLFKMYNAQAPEDLKVKGSFFRQIFNTAFNIGFGSPRTDVCSFCLECDEKLKLFKNDNTKKQDIMVIKRVHKLKAKAFYRLLKENKPKMKILSFDCEKNLALPKLPDQSTYYSRQLYLYNFTIVEGHSKSSLTPDNVFSYCWTENEFQKSSNEIASAVYHRLNNTDFTDIEVLRLVADGCGGQNKNTTIIGMCAKWLSETPSSVTRLEIVFPIVGHSFLPPDRVFGNIEKVIRKCEVIANPLDYLNIIKTHSTVIMMGRDCEVSDWRQSSQNVYRPTGSWHFGFQRCKRFFLKKKNNNVFVRGEENYCISNGAFRAITRKGKNASMVSPKGLPIGEVVVKEAKKKDVVNLLKKHYGNDWQAYPELKFYETFSNFVATELQDEIESNDNYSEPQLIDISLSI